MSESVTCKTQDGFVLLHLHDDHVEVRLSKGKQERRAHLLPSAVFQALDDFLAGNMPSTDRLRKHFHPFLLYRDEGGGYMVEVSEQWHTLEDSFELEEMRAFALQAREQLLADAAVRMIRENADAWGILWMLSLDPEGGVRMADLEEAATSWFQGRRPWFKLDHIRPFSLHKQDLYRYMDVLAQNGVIEITQNWGYWYTASRLGRALLARTNVSARVMGWEREAGRRTRRFEAVDSAWEEQRNGPLAAQQPDGWRLATATVEEEEYAIVLRPDGSYEINDSVNGFSDIVLTHAARLGEAIRTQCAKDQAWMQMTVTVEETPVPIRRRKHYGPPPAAIVDPKPLRGPFSLVQVANESGSVDLAVEEIGRVGREGRKSSWEETYFLPLDGEADTGQWFVRRETRDWSNRPPRHDRQSGLCPRDEVPEDVLAPHEGRTPDPAKCVMTEKMDLRKLAAGAGDIRILSSGDTASGAVAKGEARDSYDAGEIVIVKTNRTMALGKVIGPHPDASLHDRLLVKGMPGLGLGGPPPHAAFGETVPVAADVETA